MSAVERLISEGWKGAEPALDLLDARFRCQACGRWVKKTELVRYLVFPSSLYHHYYRNPSIPCGPVRAWP